MQAMAQEERELAPNEDLLRVVSGSTEKNPLVQVRSLGYTVVNSALLRHVRTSAENVRDAAEKEASLRGLSGLAKRKAAQAAVREAEEQFQRVLDEFIATPTKKRFTSIDDSPEFDYTGAEVEERHTDEVMLGSDFEVIDQDGTIFLANELGPGDVISLRVTEPAKDTTESGSGKAEMEIRLVDRATGAALKSS